MVEATNERFEIWASPSEVGDLVELLSEVEGVSVSIPVSNLNPRSPDAEHPSYSLDWTNLVPIIVDLVGLGSSIVGLASAIFSFKTLKKKESIPGDPPVSEPAIRVGDDYNLIVHFSNEQELASFLRRSKSPE